MTDPLDGRYSGQAKAVHVSETSFSVDATQPDVDGAQYIGQSAKIATEESSPAQWDDQSVTSLAWDTPVYPGRSQAIHVFGDIVVITPPPPVPGCKCCEERAGCIAFDDFDRSVDANVSPYTLGVASSGYTYVGGTGNSPRAQGCDGSSFFVSPGSNYSTHVVALGSLLDPWSGDTFLLRTAFRITATPSSSELTGFTLAMHWNNWPGFYVEVAAVGTAGHDGGLGFLVDTAFGPQFDTVAINKTDWVANVWYVAEYQLIAGVSESLRVYALGELVPDWQATQAYAGSALSADDFYLLLDTYNSTSSSWRAEVSTIDFCETIVHSTGDCADASTTLIFDNFERPNNASSLGSANTGDAWTYITGRDPAAIYSIEGGVGVITLPTLISNNAGSGAVIPVGVDDVAMTFDTKFEGTPSSGPYAWYERFLFGFDNLAVYRIGVTYDLVWELQVQNGGTHTILTTTGGSAGSWWTIKLERGATYFRIKLWLRDFDTEPVSWMEDVTRSSAVSPTLASFRVGGGNGFGGTGTTKILVDNISIPQLDQVIAASCAECEDPDNPGVQIPAFTPGYLPTFRRQIGDPTTRLDSFICTLESAAMVLDWHTRGAVKVWGGELIPWCGRTEAEILAHGGTNLGNARQAWLHWGQHLDVRSGETWDDLMACLAQGRAVILQGDYGIFNLAERCQDSFVGGHAISIYPYQTSNRLLVGDPICHNFKSFKISSLQAYAEAFGVEVFGVTSPQKILFAVSRPWVP